MTRFILDTGPLVALIDNKEPTHHWVVSEFARITSPLLTCEPVLTEACHLLARIKGGRAAVLEFVRRGVLTVPLRLADEVLAVSKLMARYADQPMSLADACLVRLSERHPSAIVLTLDSDFRHYRRNGRQVIPLRMP